MMQTLPDASVNCCITSPPYYGLRDYKSDGQIGMEETPEAYVAKLVSVFREVKRVLRDDGTLWLNLGDSYAANRSYQVPSTKGGPKHSPAQGDCGASKVPVGLKPKDLIGIPWMAAFALRADGWYLRQDIIWSKPNPMPESVTDRCTKAHEYIFMLSKSERYYYNTMLERSSTFKPSYSEKSKTGVNISGNMSDRGVTRTTEGLNAKPAWEKTKEFRNRRSVWTVATRPYKGSHFATFPPDLIRPCVLAGCPVGGAVLDPFGGSGTTAQVAMEHFRNAVLCELNPEYVTLIHQRLGNIQPRLIP